LAVASRTLVCVGLSPSLVIIVVALHWSPMMAPFGRSLPARCWRSAACLVQVLWKPQDVYAGVSSPQPRRAHGVGVCVVVGLPRDRDAQTAAQGVMYGRPY
jgi:hypothetical protein